ncbi:2,3-dihydro-2,3-dihydroxybenzoate dehydrogenase [Endozoicomonas sp. Mp262]|uniref:2,3-dihydro-2,3-dihydroxybenzoate dehydrogenase n=1 Tax=Endozoicomonas sp. Mp262 TaxID=2919499 RepID=UPI0021DB0ED5
MNFYNKVALITGAAQGIGKTVAESLAKKGATVALLDINTEALETLESELLTAGYKASIYTVDIGNSHQVNEAITCIESQLGPIDMLVNVAAILRMGNLTELSDNDWNATLTTNTTGFFNTCRVIGKLMKERRQGVIVNVSSNAAKTPRTGMGAYAASKAAISQLTRCLGLELAEYGIRCNLVSPGSTDTPMQRILWTDDTMPEQILKGSPESYRLGIPLQKIATPQDIANTILFLLSDDAGHITMEEITVDGGATLGV